MSYFIRKMSKARQEGEQKRGHMLNNWELIMNICAFQGKWTELSQICQHLPSDSVWQEFRQRAVVLPTVRNNPEVCQARHKVHICGGPPAVAPSNLSRLLHLLPLSSLANCCNYVNPDLKVISTHAPTSQTLYCPKNWLLSITKSGSWKLFNGRCG